MSKLDWDVLEDGVIIARDDLMMLGDWERIGIDDVMKLESGEVESGEVESGEVESRANAKPHGPTTAVHDVT